LQNIGQDFVPKTYKRPSLVRIREVSILTFWNKQNSDLRCDYAKEGDG